MTRFAGLALLILGAVLAFPGAQAFAQTAGDGNAVPPKVTSEVGLNQATQCSEPGYWPVPGAGGCLKIDGAGDVPDNMPAAVMGITTPDEQQIPDMSGAFKVSRSWGSMQLSGVGGKVDVLNSLADDQVLGWGIAAGADFNLPTGEGDKLGYNMHYGQGGQKLMMGKGVSVQDVYSKLPVGGEAETLESWGGSVWVQHWWSDTIRSNLVGGVVAADIPPSIAALSPSLTDRAWYGAANVIWSPMSQLNLGLEVIYGQIGSVGNAAVPSEEDDLFRFQASVQKTF